MREYWIVDLAGDAVEVCRAPGTAGFEHVERLTRGATLSPLAFPDASLAVVDILG